MSDLKPHDCAAPASATHLIIIPSYNPGERVFETVCAALSYWKPVWVVVDGSTDGSAARLLAMERTEPGLRVLPLACNSGKGAAVLHGIRAALRAGFSHALVLDSDGQHPAEKIPLFMSASLASLESMILGRPIFGSEAPRVRVNGRKISNAWVRIETLSAAIGDSLYGFRVYPIAPLEDIMSRHMFMRRFDFDVEAVVRLAWAGVPAINLPAPVRYFSKDEGGVTHFRYARDNALLTWMHARLFAGFLARLPRLLSRRLRPARRGRLQDPPRGA